jgi:hypothetical protein
MLGLRGGCLRGLTQLLTRSNTITQHSIMTDPREHDDLPADLPSDVPGLVRVVQSALTHPFCVELYHVQLSPHQRSELYLHSMIQMLARVKQRQLLQASGTRPASRAQNAWQSFRQTQPKVQKLVGFI